MSYVAIGKALYDYTAQAEDELNLTEDEGLYILDNSDPEWWKAKRRPPIDANGHPQPSSSSDEQEVGLVPANYVEEAEPLRMSRALYDYEKQNEDELDVQEDELLRVYEYEGEWLLVKRQGSDDIGTGEGKLGFVPANYVDEVRQLHLESTSCALADLSLLSSLRSPQSTEGPRKSTLLKHKQKPQKTKRKTTTGPAAQSAPLHPCEPSPSNPPAHPPLQLQLEYLLL